MLQNLKKPQLFDLAILINILLIIFLLIIFSRTNIDLNFQKFFFDFKTKKWLIDKNEPIAKFFFYNLPKILLGLVMAISLVALVFTSKSKQIDLEQKNSLKKIIFSIQNFLQTYHRQLLIFLLGITLIPLTAGNIKKFTNIYCPNQLEIYDGNYPYTRILDHYPENFYQTKKGQCFPAGHAVTGFCLMILFFVFQKKSWKIFGLLSGLILGWILGFYQIAKGAHFLSDTAVAMLCCFLVALIIARIMSCIFDENI